MKKIIFTRQNSYTDSRWWQFSIKKKQYFEFFYAHCPEFAGISPTDLIQKLPYASEKYILLFFFPTKRSLELTENINLLIANANVKKKSLFSFVYSTYEITWYVLKALFQNFLDIYIYKKKSMESFIKTKSCLISSFAVFITILWEFWIKLFQEKRGKNVFAAQFCTEL